MQRNKAHGRLSDIANVMPCDVPAKGVTARLTRESHNRVRDMKAKLGRPNDDATHDAKVNLDAETRLRKWLAYRQPNEGRKPWWSR